LKLIGGFANFFSEAAFAGFCDEIDNKYPAIGKTNIDS
jgi:hypothetical protein